MTEAISPLLSSLPRYLQCLCVHTVNRLTHMCRHIMSQYNADVQLTMTQKVGMMLTQKKRSFPE